ncbi:MAG: DUF4347 domain-containing protein, partial [Hyphomicrobium sp.]
MSTKRILHIVEPLLGNGFSSHDHLIKKPNFRLGSLEKHPLQIFLPQVAQILERNPLFSTQPLKSHSQSVQSNTFENFFIIDSSLADYSSLVSAFPKKSAYFVLDANPSALLQLQMLLSTFKGLQSIQILSHGNSGNLFLGGQSINNETLSQHTALFKAMSSALSPDGDLLLYGCNVASGEGGQKFVQDLAHITGADVAASSDLTGSAKKGGDWNLEVHSGTITSQSFTSSSYNSLLAVLIGTEGNDSIHGTSADDTILALGGRDIIWGGAGNDFILGGDGRDTLIGGIGGDIQDGGEGADLYLVASSAHFVGDYLYDTGTLPTDIDELRFTSAIAGQTLTLTAATLTAIERIVIGTGGGLAANTTAKTALNINAQAVAYDLSITGNSGKNRLTAGLANDKIIGFVGADTVNGGKGFDTIILNATSTDLNAATNTQISQIEAISAEHATSGVVINLSAQTEGFFITGGHGADSLKGGSGHDTFNNFIGADTVDGGGGTDRIVLTATSTALNTATDAQIVNVEKVSAASAPQGVVIT